MRESQYQSQLIKRLLDRFPEAIVFKTDSSYLQGFPDLIILYKKRWAALEVKAYADAEVQPNQGYYIEIMGQMSFARFIYPEIEEEVLDALQQAFEPPRRTRVSKS